MDESGRYFTTGRGFASLRQTTTPTDLQTFLQSGCQSMIEGVEVSCQGVRVI